MGGDTRRLREAGPPAGGTTQAPVLPLPRAVPAVSRCERAETHRGTSRFVQLHFGGLSSSFATSDESFVARGCSAVGSASPCQGEGRGFESRHPLEGAVASTPAVEWPSGEATACKAVHTGSIPVSTSNEVSGAISSAGERFPDTEEVTGSIPVSRTTICAGRPRFFNKIRAVMHKTSTTPSHAGAVTAPRVHFVYPVD